MSTARDKRKYSDLTRQPVCSDEIGPENSPALRPYAPGKNNFRVGKTRTNRRSNSRQTVAAACPDINSGLTEDDLFRLLIGKIKQREESDAAVANLQAKLEADITGLKTENKSLKDQVDTFCAQLQKRALESRSYKAQIDNWKAKLGKFKQVLNVLGTEYQALRGESDHLKATGASLKNDKQELSTCLDEAKKQISQVSRTVNEGRTYFSESKNIISTLRNSIKDSDDKADCIRIRLADEKRRTAVLEAYIQKQSHMQGKQIKTIRDDQLEMMEKTKSGFELISKQWEFSQSNIQSITKPMLEECIISIKGLGEKYAADKTDIQQIASVIQELLSQ